MERALRNIPAAAATTSNSGSRWRMWPLTADRYGDRYLPQGAVEGRYGAFVSTGRAALRRDRPAAAASHAATAGISSQQQHAHSCILKPGLCDACAGQATAGMADVRAESSI
jgi:hypothetical protein